jgi:hypothetical protein
LRQSSRLPKNVFGEQVSEGKRAGHNPDIKSRPNCRLALSLQVPGRCVAVSFHFTEIAEPVPRKRGISLLAKTGEAGRLKVTGEGVALH